MGISGVRADRFYEIMKTKEEIQDWLRAKLAELTRKNADEIATDAPFTDFGLDSIVIVSLSVDLEDWLGVSFDPTVFWEYPSINKLTDWLLTTKLSR